MLPELRYKGGWLGKGKGKRRNSNSASGLDEKQGKGRGGEMERPRGKVTFPKSWFEFEKLEKPSFHILPLESQ